MTLFFITLNTSNFVPKKACLRGNLLHNFIQKKSAIEAHRILVETYGDHALSKTTRKDWFKRFKNNDSDVDDKERPGAPKKFEDEVLEALLTHIRRKLNICRILYRLTNNNNLYLYSSTETFVCSRNIVREFAHIFILWRGPFVCIRTTAREHTRGTDRFA